MRHVLLVITIAVFVATITNHESQRSKSIDSRMQMYRDKREFVATSDLHVSKDESKNGQNTSDLAGRD